MYSTNMDFKITGIREGFATIDTFVIPYMFMNSFNMRIKVRRCTKNLATLFTSHIFPIFGFVIICGLQTLNLIDYFYLVLLILQSQTGPSQGEGRGPITGGPAKLFVLT